MKKLASVSAFALAGTPALAHSGAHMHPHSVEAWSVGLGALLASAALIWALRR
jgi:hypothetical protein